VACLDRAWVRVKCEPGQEESAVGGASRSRWVKPADIENLRSAADYGTRPSSGGGQWKSEVIVLLFTVL
jgi:hypothetical protein